MKLMHVLLFLTCGIATGEEPLYLRPITSERRVTQVLNTSKELSVLRSDVSSEEPILLRLCVTRTGELNLLSYIIGPYTDSPTASYRYEVRKGTEDGVHYRDYQEPQYRESPVPLGDNQALEMEKMPCNVTFSRVDMLSLSEPGTYVIRSVMNYAYFYSPQGFQGPIRESIHVNEVTNWVTVTVRSPEEVGEEDVVMSAGIRATLPERMFNYYYPQQRFLYYAYGSQTAWSRSRDRERFSLEHPWRESQAWPKDSPWREYLHFTAAAEALADSMSRFGSETSKMEYETGPTPLRPGYVEEVVCSFFKEYPDSWLRPQLLHHYNRYFFNRFGAIIPCIEAAYEKCVQETDPAHAAILESDGRPERRVIYNVYTREMKVVVE